MKRTFTLTLLLSGLWLSNTSFATHKLHIINDTPAQMRIYAGLLVGHHREYFMEAYSKSLSINSNHLKNT